MMSGQYEKVRGATPLKSREIYGDEPIQLQKAAAGLRIDGHLTVSEMTQKIDNSLAGLHGSISQLEDRLHPILSRVDCPDTGRPVSPVPARSDLVEMLVNLNEKIGDATYRVQTLIDRTEL